MSIKAIDKASIHHITSGQVVIDLQTAVKELVENSVDAGATSIDVRFRSHGLSSIEVIDNGCGIAEEDHESIAMKHHTSKLETFSDLTTVDTFGFRGEALSSLCALSEQVTVTTATAATAPMGVTLVMDTSGKIKKRSTVARNQGTSITLTNIFSPLAVRRKELERNIKREYAKALSLLNAYALGPCAAEPGIRLTVSNQQDKGAKSVQIKTLGSPSCRASVTALWGPKSLENVVDIDLTFEVERQKIAIKRLQSQDTEPFSVRVRGLISKFSVGCGRSGTDRQFFFVNGRPCNMSKVQKCFNEVYRSFNATQVPFIVADFILPTQLYDVNVSPDKRTILLHSEVNIIQALKSALEEHFAPLRSTFDLGETQAASKQLSQSTLQVASSSRPARKEVTITLGDSAPHKANAATSKSLTNSSNDMGRDSTVSDDEHNEPTGFTMVVAQGDGDSVQSPPLVLDTSQASWGGRLGLSTPKDTARPSPLPADYNDEDDIVEDPEMESHIHKKRKSNIGAIPILTSHATERRVSSSGPSRSPSVESSTPRTDMRILAKVGQAKLSSMPSTRINPQTSGAKPPKGKGVVDRAHDLQSQLAGFSRPGSQITLPHTSLPDEDEDEDEDETEAGGGGKDEVGDKVANKEVQEDLGDEGVPPHSPECFFPADSINLDISLMETGDIDAALHSERQSAVSLVSTDSPESTKRPSSSELASGATLLSPRNDKPHIEILKREQDHGDISLRFDVRRTKAIWINRTTTLTPINGESTPGVIPVDASVTNTEDGDRAATALSRVIEKQDFAEMDIVGQFNLGFIIVRRQGEEATRQPASQTKGLGQADDLFIVDQHAADEKYNFETLQATTKIESQKLFRPRPLELTASDEMVAIENMDILRQNGFEIDIDLDIAVSESGRLKLTAQPVSKSTTFDLKDLEEVIHLLRDRSGRQMVRCSKARAMFAMRACRKSVMVGMPLTSSQMTTVVRHMGTMDQPWNCPHGRPTMRHLIDIRSCGSHLKTNENINWSSFP